MGSDTGWKLSLRVTAKDSCQCDDTQSSTTNTEANLEGLPENEADPAGSAVSWRGGSVFAAPAGDSAPDTLPGPAVGLFCPAAS